MTESAVPGDPLDQSLRALVDRGEIDRATEDAIRAYGPELISWLRAIVPSEADAHDAFSRLSEELWKSLPRFDGRCSVRAWCYMLARHAASRVHTQPRRQHEVLVSQIPSLVHAVTHVWNTTHRNAAQVQDVYAEIRASLDPDDQALLVLRVDRNLAWRDIALVLLGQDADGETVDKRAAALRKQFERVKVQLRELAAKHMRD